MRKRSPYRPIGEDEYGLRSFLKNSAALLGGAGFTGTLGALFRKLEAAEATPELKGNGYKDGKKEDGSAVKTGEFFFPRLKFHVLEKKYDIWDVGLSRSEERRVGKEG